jgi:hypothetical protein
MSVVEFAKANNLNTIGNRPLNAITPEDVVRLAMKSVIPPSETEIQEQWDRCLDLIGLQMAKFEVVEDLQDFDVIRVLNARANLQSSDAVNLVFHQYFYPFIYQLYEGEVPESDAGAYASFHSLLARIAKHRMNESATTVRSALIAEGLIKGDDPRPLPVIACQSYLESGINHVLVGMRKVSYVDELKFLFGRAEATKGL